MDYLSYVLTWFHAGAGLIVVGTMIVLLLLGDGEAESIKDWRFQCLRIGLYLSVVVLVTGALQPSSQAIFLEENIQAAFDLNVLKIVLFSTRFGTVWMVQESIALIILISFALSSVLVSKFGNRRYLVFMVVITLVMLSAGTFKSHAAALEPIWPGLLGNSLHLIAAGIWAGGLPAIFFLLRSVRRNSHGLDPAVIEQTLRRFSALAMVMVVVVLLSGILIGSLQVSRWGELFSTPYGYLLLMKLIFFAMMLLTAAAIRWRYLSNLELGKLNSVNSLVISKWVALEISIGLTLLAVASVLKETTPAAHEEVVIWPFNFRFSIEATWDESSAIQTQVIIGLCLLASAIVLATLLFYKRRSVKQAAFVGVVLSVAGLVVGLPPLSVEAYPDTYRNSTVPYLAVSIENGEALFREHCVICHGEGGRGDGILAKTLSTSPANLTEPHTALHTVGDMYWWLTHGMGDDKAMPSFAEKFDEDEMWDIINYLRAFSEGFSGRLLMPTIAPELPFLGAPDFYYSTSRHSGNLKDLREEKAILLVFFSWPQSRDRLIALKKSYDLISGNDAEIIAIAMRGAETVPEELINQSPFPIITEETYPITRTFAQYRRTFEYSGDLDDKDLPMHMEFTLDRFGYLRSRWIPEQTPGTWDAPFFLAQQFAELAEEDGVLPPPDEHIH